MPTLDEMIQRAEENGDQEAVELFRSMKGAQGEQVKSPARPAWSPPPGAPMASDSQFVGMTTADISKAKADEEKLFVERALRDLPESPPVLWEYEYPESPITNPRPIEDETRERDPNQSLVPQSQSGLRWVAPPGGSKSPFGTGREEAFKAFDTAQTQTRDAVRKRAWELERRRLDLSIKKIEEGRKLNAEFRELVHHLRVNEGFGKTAAEEEAHRRLIVKPARDQARAEALERGERAVDVQGQRTSTGIGGFVDQYLPFVPPMYRRSKIVEVDERWPGDPTKTILVKKYEDPETGELRDPTDAELAWESMARQEALTPEQIKRMQEAKAWENVKRFKASGGLVLDEQGQRLLEEQIVDTSEPAIKNLLSVRERGSGRIIETPLAAMLRVSGIVPTVVNEAVLQYAPLFWEQDPETGEPVNPNDAAYQIHRFMRDSMLESGFTEEEVERNTTGSIHHAAGGRTARLGALASIPVPFQPIQRGAATGVDPTAHRAAAQSGSFIARTAHALARGRSLGDELMSIPAYVADFGEGSEYELQPGYGVLAEDYLEFRNTGPDMPFWMGIIGEIPYGIGPFAAIGKVTKGAARAARATGKAPTAVNKIAAVVADPTEAANRAKVIRITQELNEHVDLDRDALDVLKDVNSVSRVVGETVAEHTIAPYSLAAALRVAGDGPITVGQLSDLAENSPQARLLLQDAGLLNRDRNHTLSWAEKRKLSVATSSHIASAYSDVARTIDASAELSEMAKANRILDKVDAHGLDRAYIRGIQRVERIARGEHTEKVKDVIEDVFPTGGAIPIRNARPVMGAIHEVGSQVLRAADSKTAVRAEGSLSRILNRRLGDKPFNSVTLATSPQEVHRAASAAAGRAVEATLENAVPRDMTFITKTLMAPRKLLTKEVYDAVASRVSRDGPDGWTVAHQKVGGQLSGDNWYRYSDPATARRFEAAIGAGNVERSAKLKAIVRRLEAGEELNAIEHGLVQDALLTRAFEDVLGSRAKEALFEGRQTERARAPGVNIGLESAPEARVSRTSLFGYRGGWGPKVDDASTIVKELGGQQIAKAMNRVRKVFKREVKRADGGELDQQLVPFAWQEAWNTLKRERGALSDNLYKEVRAEAARLKGNKDRGQVGLNNVVGRRTDALVRSAVEKLEHQVRHLQDQLGMTESQAYYYAAYQAGAGKAVEGLGQKGVTAEIRKVAVDRAAVYVLEESWEEILRTFFGADVFEKLKAGGVIDRMILKPSPKGRPGTGPRAVLEDWMIDAARAKREKSPVPPRPNLGPSAYRDITTADLRDIIEEIRAADPSLKGIGLQRGLPGYGIDAIADTLFGWALGVDDKLLMRRVVEQLRRDDPGVFVDLMPSLEGARPDRVVTTARFPLDVRGSVLRALGAKPQDPAYQAAVAAGRKADGNFEVTRNGTFEPLVGGPGSGSVIHALDNMSGALNIGMNPAARLSVAENTLMKALERGAVRATSDEMTDVMTDVFGEGGVSLEVGGGRELQKRAVSEHVKALLEQYRGKLKASPLSGLGEALDPEDAIDVAYNNDVDKLFARLMRDIPDDQLVPIISNAIIDQATKTYVAPLVEEMATSHRMMGHTPGAMKGDAGNLQQMAAKMDLNDPALMVLGSQWNEAAAALKESAASGKLARNLEQLKQAERWTTFRSKKLLSAAKAGSATSFALHLLSDVATTSRRYAAGGLLGGGLYLGVYEHDKDLAIPYVVPAPNTRYIGMNLLTAPIIGLTTVGAANAIRMPIGAGARSQAGDVGQELRRIAGKPLVNANAKLSPSDIMFTSDTGRSWTRQELDDAIGRNNILISRGQVEFNDSFNTELIRAAGVMADGTSLPPGVRGVARRIARELDPTATGFAQYVANATDKAFRENMFATALKDGMTEAQAARLARAVVLDYGRVPAAIRNNLNRYVLFATFRFVNTVEMMESLARDPKQFVRMVNFMDNHQQRNDAGMLGPDYARVRPLLSDQYIVDEGLSAAIYGPSMPNMEAFADMTNLASYLLQTTSKNNRFWERAGETVVEENLAPIVSGIVSEVMLSDRKEGSLGYKVPTPVVEWAIRNGPNTTWPYLKRVFNITPTGPESAKVEKPGRGSAIDPQDPEAGHREYYFSTPEDEANFTRVMMALMQLGVQRTTTDWTKASMGMFGNEFTFPGARALANPMLFGVGAETPITLPDAARALYFNSKRMERLHEKADPNAP